VKLRKNIKDKKRKNSENLREKQKDHIRNVKDDTYEETYGTTKLFRLVLAKSPFVFPNIYVRHLWNKRSYLAKKKWIEVYVLFKLLLPVLVLSLGWCHNYLIIVLICYLLLETIFYLLSLIFLSDTYNEPHSAKRSMLFVILNYMEVTFDFAVIYKGFELVSKPIDYFVVSATGYSTISVNSLAVEIVNAASHKAVLSPLEAIYFSYVTSTTVGYGEYLPSGEWGNFVVILQVTIMLIFLILFINYFASILMEERSKLKNEKNNKKNHDKELRRLISHSKEWNEDKRKELENYMKYLESKS